MKQRAAVLNWVIGILFFAFAAEVSYWTVFFTSGAVQVRSDEVYLAFERSFPLAGAWLAVSALLGAIGLLAKADGDDLGHRRGGRCGRRDGGGSHCRLRAGGAEDQED